jgi:hypothetical protein
MMRQYKKLNKTDGDSDMGVVDDERYWSGGWVINTNVLKLQVEPRATREVQGGTVRLDNACGVR